MVSWRSKAIPAATLAAIVLALGALALRLAFQKGEWTRDHPLSTPITVTEIHEGVLTLADGRALRPAGVQRHPDASMQDYDAALRVITAQGVVIVRDLGDGRAMLLAEPKFYNWCGNSSGRWAGGFYQCPVSELLIQRAYATADLQQPGLTERERWRLEGVPHAFPVGEWPTSWNTDDAFAFGGSEKFYFDYDATIEMMWKPPPQ